MASVEDLARLKTLADQLSRLAQAQPGELILAESWNTLVGAVIAVARTVYGQDSAVQVPSHTHLDQVAADWLVPMLRDQLQRGPLADPAMQARLLALEQQVRTLVQRLDRQGEDLTGFRGRLTEVATRDIVRESAVTDVTRRVAGLDDARADVLDLRRSLGTVQNDLGTVLEAARRLQVDGETVDVGALVGRVTALEGFRQAFTGANGQVLDAATLDQRFAETRNQFVTQAQLDEALETRAGTIPPEVVAGLEDRIGTALRAQVTASFETFASQIRGETSGRLAGIGDLVATRVNEAMAGVTQSVTGAVAASIAQARQEATTAAVTQATANTAAREAAVRRDMDRLSADLRASFAAAVRDQLTQLLPGVLTGVRSDLASLGTRLDALSARTAQAETTVSKQADAIASLQQDAGRLRLELRDTLQNEVRLAADALSRELTARLQSMQTDIRAQFDTLSRDVRQQAIDQARQAAVATAQAETRNARTQILAEMRQVAREEAGTLVRDQLRATPGAATPGTGLNTGPLRDRIGGPVIDR